MEQIVRDRDNAFLRRLTGQILLVLSLIRIRNWWQTNQKWKMREHQHLKKMKVEDPYRGTGLVNIANNVLFILYKG